MISLPYGKEITYVMVDELSYMEHQRKLIWIRAEEPLTLAARISANGWDVGIYDDDLIPVHKWCHDNNCGKRISFDRFRFRSRKEITMFLLRWT